MSFRGGFFRRTNLVVGTLVEKTVARRPLEYGLNKGFRTTKVVVSMASYAARFATIEPTLRSLVTQSVKPDKILVYLDEDEPTEAMRAYEQYGVEFIQTSDELRPHKKYYYAMQSYPDSIVITVDDDIVYPHTLLAKLLAVHAVHPEAVVTYRAHKMTFTDGVLDPYQDWVYECRSELAPTFELFATGGAGCLYPPHCLPDEAFDKDAIKELSWNADDVWLKVMELLAGTPVVWAANALVMPKESTGSQEQSLQADNVWQGTNDQYLKALFERYPAALDRLSKETV